MIWQLVFGLLTVLVGGGIGLGLHAAGASSPPMFWFIGASTGIVALLPLIWTLAQR